jgi:hypothetical protein
MKKIDLVKKQQDMLKEQICRNLDLLVGSSFVLIHSFSKFSFNKPLHFQPLKHVVSLRAGNPAQIQAFVYVRAHTTARKIRARTYFTSVAHK